MPLELLTEVFGACGAPKWSDNNEVVDLVVEHRPVFCDTLRKLEADEVFVDRVSSPSNPRLQNEVNSGRVSELPLGSGLTLRLPRIVNRCVVAKDLADLLSITSATYSVPQTYFLLSVEGSKASFCFLDHQSVLNAPPLVKRYHDAVALWRVLEGQAEHCISATRNLLFFGIRRTEMAPRFSIKDLAEDISLAEIKAFTEDKDREEARKEIFQSVLSEFLQDQKPERTFSYLLRQSSLFARRLREGLAIYLSDHSPEKLAKEAQASYLDLADRLEKIVSGMEAKSLSIPAAVLLAVKEAEFGGKWTTLNAVILISAVLYLVTMFIVFSSQRAMLNLLKKTISRTTQDLKEQGLDERNPVLSDSFAKLETRRLHTQIGSWAMLIFSCVPLAAVLYAVFCAQSPTPSAYSFKVTTTNGIQIIQMTNAPASPLVRDTAGQPGTNQP